MSLHSARRTTATLAALTVALLATLLPAALGGGATWRWPLSGWAFRKRVYLGDRPGWASKDFARTWVWTGGRGKSDGSDIRVTTPAGEPLPHRVVTGTPQGKHLVVFRKPENGNYVAIYYGNPGAGPVQGVQSRTGLILETRPLPENVDAVRNWETASRLLQSGGERYGMDYVERAFKGFNPHGKQKYFAFLFRGYLRAPQAGVYRFGVMSTNSSFLFIDGNPVSAWTGKHEVERNRKGNYPHSGTIRLNKGLHRFRQVTFVLDNKPISAAVWKPPGKNQWDIIRRRVFRTPAPATVELAERQGAAACAEFRPKTVDYLEVGSARMVAVKLQSLSSTPRGQISGHRWSFGDGLAGGGKAPLHVYFLPGTYPVQLQVATTEGQSASLTRPIRVEPMRQDLDFREPVKKKFVRWTRGYDLTQLPTRCLAAARDFLGDTEQHDRLVQLSLEAIRRQQDLKRSEVCDAALFLGKHYLQRAENAEKALQNFQLALRTASGNQNKEFRARLGIADTHLRLSGDAEKARKNYQSILDELSDLSKEDRRDVRLRIGDTYRLAGEVEKARDAYSQASQMTSSDDKAPRSIARAQFIQSIEAYLGEGRTEPAQRALEKWLTQYPKDRLLPQALWLKGRTHLVAGNFRKALNTSRTYLNYGSDPDYTPRVLLVAGEACMELGRGDQAVTYFRKIDEQYPESSVVTQARDHLERLQG